MRIRELGPMGFARATGITLACALLAPAAASAAPAPRLAVAGQLLAAPAPDAVVRTLPVRVAVDVPRGTSRLRVRVGRRDVTARFRRTAGGRRVAHLTRRDGLHPGSNRLVVVAERRGRRPVLQARSFFVVRRSPRLARLRLREGPVTSVDVDLPGTRGLAALERRRTGELWLNGRRITRGLDRSQPWHWRASLSASHGLRHGVNRLRLVVVDRERGRYVDLRRRFVVRRTRHLAAAGWDVGTPVGGPVRLDGRRSRTLEGTRADHRWSIVSKPRGSAARLRGAGSARPVLTPDRPGRYVVGLTVTGRARGAGAAQVAAAAADQVTVTAGPSSLLVPFQGHHFRGGMGGDPPSGVQVGDTLYEATGVTWQWLTLDRVTLTPTGTGNTWLDRDDTGAHSLKALTTALKNGSTDQLVVLALTMGNRFGRAVNPDQVDDFNAALGLIGVAPFPASILTTGHQQIVAMGVPYGEPGSGWSSQRSDTGASALGGWLMPDADMSSAGARRFRFQPERPEFNTAVAHTPSSNTMAIRDKQVVATLPAGTTGGFHVVEIDPHEFTVVQSDVFGSNGSWDGLGAMVARLKDIAARGNHVAVQSIGTPAPTSSTWPQVAAALAALGANPDTFARLEGGYAFLGGPALPRGENAESSAAVVTDPTPGRVLREPGTLEGRARIGADGIFMALEAEALGRIKDDLYDIVFQAPAPWPFTGAADPTGAYARALADITANDPRLKGWAPDLRRAYIGNTNLTYSDSKTDLARMPYPGDGRPCTPAAPAAPDPTPAFTRYTREQFCALNAQLQSEFSQLDATKTLFDAYEKAIIRSGGQQVWDLQSLGQKIHEAVDPPEESILVSPALGVTESLFEVGAHSVPEVGAVVSLFASVYELAAALASADGIPVGQRITTKVGDLAKETSDSLVAGANALDRLREVIISDSGRLKALGSVADAPPWAFDIAATTNTLSTAADAFFSEELMPLAYRVWWLRGTTRAPNPTVESCRQGGPPPFVDASATAWWQFRGPFTSSDGDQVNGGLWALGTYSGRLRPPPATLSDAMFRPVSQRGYGLVLQRFMWSAYTDPPRRYNCA